jgi:hypothetical protein
MIATKRVDVNLGDVVRLRKQHPCGGTDWTVVRLGADIGLRCQKCQHRVLLPRGQFERRLKSFVSRSSTPPGLPAVPVKLQLEVWKSPKAEPTSPKESSSG